MEAVSPDLDPERIIAPKRNRRAKEEEGTKKMLNLRYKSIGQLSPAELQQTVDGLSKDIFNSESALKKSNNTILFIVTAEFTGGEGGGGGRHVAIFP